MISKLNWIERLPRPDRSGVMGVLVMWCALWQILTPYSPHGTLLDQVVCEILPWKCLEREAEKDAARKQRRSNMRFITFLNGAGPGKQKIALCHYDLLRGNKVTHLLSTVPYAMEGDTKSSGDFAWKPISEVLNGLVPSSITYCPSELSAFSDSGCETLRMNGYDAAWRNHCSEDYPLCSPRKGHFFTDCARTTAYKPED